MFLVNHLSMISLNYFPTELLVIVFTKLDQGDRLTCKQVCKRWFAILMTHIKFFKDRHLCLTDCLITRDTPPMSILQNAKYPYKTLTLDHNIRFMCDPVVIHWFFETIGQDVTVLKLFGYFDSKVWKVITCFRNLQKLNLIDTTVTQMMRSCISFMDDEQKSVVFSSVEEIKEKSFQIEDKQERVSTLTSIFPNLTKIVSAGLVFTSTDAYLNAMETNMFKEGITYDLRRNEALERLLMKPKFYLRKVKFIRGEIRTAEDLKFVVELCNRYLTIQKVTMRFNGVPNINCALLANLSIKLSNTSMQDIFLLRQLVGLKKLTLYISTSDQCLQWHASILHTGVKTLTIHSGVLNCVHCYHNCLGSFPKITEFSHYITKSSAKLLSGQAIIFPISTFLNLTKFVFGSEKGFEYRYRVHDELSNYDGTHSNVKDLHLKNVTDVTDEDLRKIATIFPKLKSFSLDLFTELRADQVVEGVRETIGTLKHFNLQTKCPQRSDFDKHEVLENIVRMIIENGTNIRTLGFPSLKRINKTCLVNLLFIELNQLNFISFGEHRSYFRFNYEIYHSPTSIREI